jgi:hypothetical protein
LNLVIGVYWFHLIDFSFYRFPGEVYYPLVLWVTWILEGRSPLLWGGYLLACCLGAVLSAYKLSRLFASSPGAASPIRREAASPGGAAWCVRTVEEERVPPPSPDGPR